MERGSIMRDWVWESPVGSRGRAPRSVNLKVYSITKVPALSHEIFKSASTQLSDSTG